MIGRLLRLLVLLVVVGCLLYVFYVNVVRNTGNVLLGSHANAYGSAQLVPQGNGNSLQVNLQGLSSNLHYVVALEEGGCNGTLLKSFDSQADSNGNSSSLVPLSNSASTKQQDLWVNVHRDDISGPSIACGQVQVNKQLVTQAVSTAPTNTPIPVAPLHPTPKPTPTDTPSSLVNNSTTARGNNVPEATGLPQTGVAPAINDNYNNYTYPRKY